MPWILSGVPGWPDSCHIPLVEQALPSLFPLRSFNFVVVHKICSFLGGEHITRSHGEMKGKQKARRIVLTVADSDKLESTQRMS